MEMQCKTILTLMLLTKLMLQNWSKLDILCSKRLHSIVNDSSHKLADLLPPLASSYSSRLRNKRYFQSQRTLSFSVMPVDSNFFK